MDRLKPLTNFLNLIKNQNKFTFVNNEEEWNFENTEEYGYNKIIPSISGFDNIILALDDINMLTQIREFLDITDEERMSAAKDLANLKLSCETLSLEYYFLTQKLQHNQEEIRQLEFENTKLKSDLKLNKVNQSCQNVTEETSNIISPNSLVNYIHSSFKFDINSEKRKKYRDNSDEILIPPKLKTLYDLVMQYSIKGNYAVAIPLCEQTLIDIEKTSGKCSNDYASMLHVLANVYRDTGDYRKSASLMLEVLLIRESLPEDSKTNIVKTLNCVSMLYGLMYCWTEAAMYCQRSIAIMREIHTDDDISIAKQLESMALIYKNDNKLENAIECLEEALVIYSNDRDFHQIDLTRVQSQIAFCYLSLFQFSTSLILYKEIINNCYQSHLSAIWDVDEPLWRIAEAQEYRLSSTEFEVKRNFGKIRLFDSFDEVEFRDILSNMAVIYRHMGMNKAAIFLETWPDRNIPAPNGPNKLSKSRSMMNLNDEISQNPLTKGRSRLSISRGLSSGLSPNLKGLRPNIRVESQNGLSKRSSVSLARRSGDIDVTIFESWSAPYVVSEPHKVPTVAPSDSNQF